MQNPMTEPAPKRRAVYYLDRVSGGWQFEVRAGNETVYLGVRPWKWWAKRVARRIARRV